MLPRILKNDQFYSPLLTGWGKLIGGGDGSNILQQAMLPIANDKVCKQRNSVLLPVDTDKMICAGGVGKVNNYAYITFYHEEWKGSSRSI